MPHLGIAHKDERDVLTARPLSPVNNILSQSVANVAPRSSRGLGFLSEAQRFQGDPSIQAGATTLGRGIDGGGFRQPSETLETFRASADIQREGRGAGDIIATPATTATPTTTPIITPTPTAGITPAPAAPVLGDIDVTTFEGLVKGVGTVAEFTRNLQKFNRARGITPGGKGKKRTIKTSDIQNRIKFLQTQLNEGIVTEEQEASVTDELDILNQFIQGRLGVSTARNADKAADEERIRKLIRGEL